MADESPSVSSPADSSTSVPVRHSTLIVISASRLAIDLITRAIVAGGSFAISKMYLPSS